MNTNVHSAAAQNERPAEHEETVELIEQLRSWSKAYPEHVFGPVTEEERHMYSSLITRNSAAMGRHCGKFMAQAADALEALQKDAERWRAGVRICFPEFCGHASDAPKGSGWYHDKLSPPLTENYSYFDTAEEAMDAAMKWVSQNCESANYSFVVLKPPEAY